MNEVELLRHYERFSDGPDAIARLRQTVLVLAVRGKLLPQSAADEPVSAQLSRVPELPKPARYDKRSVELIPGDCGLSIGRPSIKLPSTWDWVPLVRVARLESGHTPSRSRPEWWGGDVPWIGLVDARLHNNGTIFETLQTTNPEGLANSAARLLPEGTVCFSRTASVGYVVIMGRPMATSQDFVNWVPSAAVSAKWLQLVMIAERPAIPRFSKGAVHQTIYYPAWLSMYIALPPIAEQHRIVAKVDELMALCDRLEAARSEREAARDRLTAASLARLNTPDPETFPEDARFALQVLPEISARPQLVDQLRLCILTLAVRGRLTAPSDANDSSIEKSGSEVSTEQLPARWRWARAEEICEAIVDCPHSTPAFVPNGVVCLDTNAFKGGAIIPAKVRYVTEESYRERAKRLAPQPGDIVFAREGSVGESVIVPDGMRCCLGQRVMLFRPSEQVDSRYFQLALSEPGSLTRLLALHKGIGAKHVNVADMRKALIPLPPLEEQQAIVTKVAELTALCARLASGLSNVEDVRRRLLESLLRESLDLRTAEEEAA